VNAAMSTKESLPAQYFQALYEGSDDPWSFATSDYEAEKYAHSLSALGPRYGNALEIACSIGVFTRALATKCDRLLAVDVSPRALELARARCRDVPQVTFAQRSIPAQFPAGAFDLITACEVGYYWSDTDFDLALDRIATGLVPKGELLLVHFLPPVDDYVRPGDAVHERFLRDKRFECVAGARAERYRLEVLRKS
jgi:SAM-dependent methyltransferase